MYNKLKDVGLHLLLGLPQQTINNNELQILRELSPSGIVFFGHNVGNNADWPERFLSLINSVKEACGRTDLMLAVDHEGGRVIRFPSPVTKFPYARDYRLLAAEVGATMAAELRALGINLSFAPVLDINSEPDNQVIGPRSFGETPSEVSEYALSYAQSLESNGILSCAKHFPGHGATKADSHFELPLLDLPLGTIIQREVSPFKRYIDWGGQLIMTAHVLYPELDPSSPATFSERIITGLLRGELGFEGVVITDDLGMAGAAERSLAERAVGALGAGVDLLLEGNPKEGSALENGYQMAEAILKLARDSQTFATKLERSSQRVAKLRAYLTALQDDHLNSNSLKLLGCKSHQELADRCFNDSMS